MLTASRTAFTAVPGSGCSWSSMKTPGVPLTPSWDIWSVALVTHCSKTLSSIAARTASSSAPASTAHATSWSSSGPSVPSAGWFSKSSAWYFAKASTPAVSATAYRALAAREEYSLPDARSRKDTTWYSTFTLPSAIAASTFAPTAASNCWQIGHCGSS